MDKTINDFLNGNTFAVVGASRDRSKYGNKVLRVYLQNGQRVQPVNPNANEVEGLKAYADLASLPGQVHGISVVTPPEVTEQVVEQAATLGIRHIWMQSGAENVKAIEKAREHGMNVIAGGPCILVVQGYHE